VSVWDRLRSYRARGPAGIARPFELRPLSELDTLIGGELDTRLSAAGLVRIGKRRWGKPWGPEMNALVELQPLNGALTAAWGLSLPFVPHLTRDFTIGWHRTLKTARFDLSFHPRDYEAERAAWVVSQLATRDELATEGPRFAADVASHALAFLTPLDRVEALPAAFEAKRDRPAVALGLESYPQELLAYAFVLARCGRNSEAEERLRIFWSVTRKFDQAQRLSSQTEREIDRLFGAIASP
jgi:hypothetical protein